MLARFTLASGQAMRRRASWRAALAPAAAIGLSGRCSDGYAVVRMPFACRSESHFGKMFTLDVMFLAAIASGEPATSETSCRDS